MPAGGDVFDALEAGGGGEGEEVDAAEGAGREAEEEYGGCIHCFDLLRIWHDWSLGYGNLLQLVEVPIGLDCEIIRTS